MNNHGARQEANPPGTLLLALSLLNVGLQLTSAALIKFAAMWSSPGFAVVFAMLAAVLALNAGRFVIWNRIHKRYPISMAYPLSAMFFPAVVVLAWFMHEPVQGWQIAGASLVMAGVIWILIPENNADAQPPVNV